MVKVRKRRVLNSDLAAVKDSIQNEDGVKSSRIGTFIRKDQLMVLMSE